MRYTYHSFMRCAYLSLCVTPTHLFIRRHIHLLFMRRSHVPHSIYRSYFSFMHRTHFSFMRCIHPSFIYQPLSLEHSRPVYLLSMYQDEHTAPYSEDRYSCIALTYRSCITFFHFPCIIYTASYSPACFLPSSCIKSSS